MSKTRYTLKFIPLFDSVESFRQDCIRRGIDLSKVTSKEGKGANGLRINESLLSRFDRNKYIDRAINVDLIPSELNAIHQPGVFITSPGYLIIDADTKKTFSIVRDIFVRHTGKTPVYRETRQGAHFFIKINTEEFDYNLPSRLDLKQESDLSIEFKRYKRSSKGSLLFHLDGFTYADGVRQYGDFVGDLTDPVDTGILMQAISEILSHFDAWHNSAQFDKNVMNSNTNSQFKPYDIGQDTYQAYFKIKDITVKDNYSAEDLMIIDEGSSVFYSLKMLMSKNAETSFNYSDNEENQDTKNINNKLEQRTNMSIKANLQSVSAFLDILIKNYLARYKNSHPLVYSDWYNNIIDCLSYYKNLAFSNEKDLRLDIQPNRIPPKSGIHNTFLFNCLCLFSSQRFTDDAEIIQEFIKIIDCAFFEEPYHLYNKSKYDRFSLSRVQQQIDSDYIKFGNGKITIDKSTTAEELDDAIGINANLFTGTSLGKVMFRCRDGIYRAIFSEFRMSRAKNKVYYYVEYCEKRDKYYIAIAQSLDEAFVLFDTSDGSKEMNSYFDKILNRKAPSKDGRAKTQKYDDSEIMSLTFVGNHSNERTIAPRSKFSIIYDGGRSCSADVSLLGYSNLIIDLLFENTEKFTKEEFENTVFYKNLSMNLMPNKNVRALHLSSFKKAIIEDKPTDYCFALDGDGLIGKSSYFDLLMQFIIGEFKFESLTNYRRKPIFTASDFDNFDTLRVYNSNAEVEFKGGVRGASVFNEDRFLNVVGYKVEEAGDISQKDRISYVKEIVRVSPSTTIKRKFKNSIQLGKDLKAVCFMLGNKKTIDVSSDDNTRLVQSICRKEFNTVEEFKKLEQNPEEYERQRRVFFGYILQTDEFEEIAEQLRYKSLAEIDDTSLAEEALNSTEDREELREASLIMNGIKNGNLEPLVNYINENSENRNPKIGPAADFDVAISIIMSSFFTTEYGKKEFKELDEVSIHWKKLALSKEAGYRNRSDVSRLLTKFYLAYRPGIRRIDIEADIAKYLRPILGAVDDTSVRLNQRFKPEYSFIDKFHKNYSLTPFGRIVNKS